jgi:transcriptional regulator with XRE-family HTH domain
MPSKNREPTLGERLQAARAEAGLSIRELAALAGINYSYLFKLESDQNVNPAAEKLRRLADALEIDPYELLQHIGVESSHALPPAKVYFRRRYGFSEDEADEVTKIIERFRSEHKVQGGEDHDKETNADTS